jgi:hypothetical protein
MLPIFRGMVRRQRRERVLQLLDQVQAWEVHGRDLLCQLLELTDPDDDLHQECGRMLELMDR